MKLKIHNIDTAPKSSKALLEKSLKSNGMLPNLHGVLATSPQTLEAYLTLHELFTQSSFNKEELTVVWQTINIEHECLYCVPAHTALANKMKVDTLLSNTLRDKTQIPTDKLQVLHEFTLKIVRNRGKISNEDLDTFYKVGYGEQQVLEIILGISQKVISNYTNYIANTPLDIAFKKFVW